MAALSFQAPAARAEEPATALATRRIPYVRSLIKKVSQPQDPLSRLPEEARATILGFLSMRDSAKCARLDRTWYQLSNSSFALEELYKRTFQRAPLPGEDVSAALIRHERFLSNCEQSACSSALLELSDPPRGAPPEYNTIDLCHYAENASLIFMATRVGNIVVWSATSTGWRQRHTLSNGTQRIFALSFKNGHLYVGTRPDPRTPARISIWNCTREGWAQVATIGSLHFQPSAMEFGKDGRLFVGDLKERVRILPQEGKGRWISLATLEEAREAPALPKQISSIQVAPDGSEVYTRLDSGQVKVWRYQADRRSWACLQTLLPTSAVGRIKRLSLAPEGSFLLADFKSGCTIWKRNTEGVWEKKEDIRLNISGVFPSNKPILGPNLLFFLDKSHIYILTQVKGVLHKTISTTARFVKNFALAENGSLLAWAEQGSALILNFSIPREVRFSQLRQLFLWAEQLAKAPAQDQDSHDLFISSFYRALTEEEQKKIYQELALLKPPASPEERSDENLQAAFLDAEYRSPSRTITHRDRSQALLNYRKKLPKPQAWLPREIAVEFMRALPEDRESVEFLLEQFDRIRWPMTKELVYAELHTLLNPQGDQRASDYRLAVSNGECAFREQMGLTATNEERARAIFGIFRGYGMDIQEEKKEEKRGRE